ncbi:PIG-L deacetylase family protein [Ferrovibrio terrae]|uniref:PIG-L deacetylase family protein n=1 Tax=Ferrovibrio terrae TaxID=2594003 RepID=UPI00313791C2
MLYALSRRLISLWQEVRHHRREHRFVFRDWRSIGDLQRSAAVLDTLRFNDLIRPSLVDPTQGGAVTVLAPHPDDEALGAGGTLLALHDHGISVRIVFLTDGEAEPGATRRRQEAAASAARLGAEAIFLGFPADAIPVDPAARQKLTSVIGPAERLFLPFLLDDNDDHRRVSELLWRCHEDGLLPPALQIWGYQVYTPIPANVLVDISAFAERKAALIHLHESQMQTRDWAHFSLGLNAFNIRLVRGPQKRTIRYVESWTVLPVAAYADLCRSYFEPNAAICYRNDAYHI